MKQSDLVFYGILLILASEPFLLSTWYQRPLNGHVFEAVEAIFVVGVYCFFPFPGEAKDSSLFPLSSSSLFSGFYLCADFSL